MLVVESKDVEKYYRALKELDGGRSLPFAARDSLNDSAFIARRVWAREGRKTMTVRNQWTFKGRHHAVNKARAKRDIAGMKSVVGNRLQYMAMQETGFVKQRPEGLQIPTKKSRIAEDKRRIVSRSYWRSKIGKSIGPRYDVNHPKFSQVGPKSRQARYIKGTVRAAKARGKRFVYLEFSDRNKGIYDIGTTPGSKKLKLVWDMKAKSTRTKANPMLKRTLRTLEYHFPIIHRANLEKQIKFVLRKRGFRVRGANTLAELQRYQSLGR